MSVVCDGLEIVFIGVYFTLVKQRIHCGDCSVAIAGADVDGDYSAE